jgi:hypothetical protein
MLMEMITLGFPHSLILLLHAVSQAVAVAEQRTCMHLLLKALVAKSCCYT